MTKPRTLLIPDFRRLDEIFSAADLERLDGFCELVWARDDKIPVDVFRAELARADAVVFGTWPDPSSDLTETARLRVALEVAGGHHHLGFDYRSALERGILVGSCAPAFANVVAEHALALTLAELRGIVSADRAMRSGDEAWLHDGNVTNRTLEATTIGIVGFGGIARRLVAMLGPFRCRVLATDPFVAESDMRASGAEPARLDEVLSGSDVVYIAAAPTDENRELVSRRHLELLSPGALLVLISRASLVDFDAAVELADAGRIRFATDVYPDEPIPVTAPVRSARNTLLTPHLAGALPDALRLIGRMVVDDLAMIFSGVEPTQMQYLSEETFRALVRSAG